MRLKKHILTTITAVGLGLIFGWGFAGHEANAHRTVACGGQTIEDLRQARQGLAYGVAGEEVTAGKAAGVVEQEPQGDPVLRCKSVVGHLPALQLEVDVLIERKLPLLDQIERSHRRHRFADRAGLEQGVGRHPPGTSQCLLTAEAQSKFTPMSEYIFEYPT